MADPDLQLGGGGGGGQSSRPWGEGGEPGLKKKFGPSGLSLV